MQITAKITFQFPLKEKTVRNLSVVTIDRGTLEVSADYAINPEASMAVPKERYQVKITSAKFKGAEVLPILDTFDNEGEVWEAGVHHAAMHANDQSRAYPPPAKTWEDELRGAIGPIINKSREVSHV